MYNFVQSPTGTSQIHSVANFPIQAPMVRRQLRYDEAENVVEEYQGRLRERHGYTPLILILRGMFGSGKSTFANEVAFHARAMDLSAVICSADFHFLDPTGGYNFRANELDQAHHECQVAFDTAIRNQTSVIVVDNTNLDGYDYRWYWDTARRFTNEYWVVEFDCVDVDMAVRLCRRSTRGIADDVARRRFNVYARQRQNARHGHLLVLPANLP